VIIDTHCHLDFDWFDGERDLIVSQAIQAGVERIIVPALDLNNVRDVLSLAERFDCAFAAVGIHPNSSAGWQDEWIELIKNYARHSKVVAIGEIGLDYYRERSPKSVQHNALTAQLQLAHELNLPVIIHNRDSSSDILNLLSNSPIIQRPKPGVFHSFLTDWETAKQALDLGFTIGFTGPLTYKNSQNLREVARRVPVDRIVVETDAPFLAPQSRRGKRNEPANTVEVVQCLAQIRGKSEEEIAHITTTNAVNLFGKSLLDQ
jgi:TatD DNase family protein